MTVSEITIIVEMSSLNIQGKIRWKNFQVKLEALGTCKKLQEKMIKLFLSTNKRKFEKKTDFTIVPLRDYFRIFVVFFVNSVSCFMERRSIITADLALPG